jgi:putative alpha-1,2-mannosidase
MSAWYIFSSLGFYPVSPGDNNYSLGSPLVSKATIHLENGKTFTVEAIDQSKTNVYVRKVLLNGKPLPSPVLKYEDILNGGTLQFFMSAKPVK